MAQINASYDTKTKKLTVNKDGKDLENVSQVMFGRNYDYEKGKEADTHGCHISTVDKSEDEGYMTHTHIVANEAGDLVERKEKLPAELGLASFIKSRLNTRRGK
jgi:hypothetical protein